MQWETSRPTKRARNTALLAMMLKTKDHCWLDGCNPCEAFKRLSEELEPKNLGAEFKRLLPEQPEKTFLVIPGPIGSSRDLKY